MINAQEEFDLRPRVTPESSREDMVKHIKDCHRKLLVLQEALFEATEETKRTEPRGEPEWRETGRHGGEEVEERVIER